MTTSFTYKRSSEGFILLPILSIILLAALILFALIQHFYTHILLTQELQQYLNAERAISPLIDTIEAQLNLIPITTPDPKDQQTLLDNSNNWPHLDENTRTYTQLIHSDSTALIYSTLIAMSDHNAQQRIIFELISICTLAERRCNPLQLTTL